MKIATVSESAFQLLKAKIITGEIGPGVKLDERRISEWLDISRPPIREAFRRLESEHLVYTIPRKGTFVSPISRKDFIELYQVRCMAECCAVEILEENRMEVGGLEDVIEDADEDRILTDATPAQELSLVVRIQAFHVRIVEAAENVRLSSFYETINSNVCRYTYIYRSVPDLVRTWTMEHRQIADLLNRGEYGEAKDRISEHINAYRRGSFLELLEKEIARKNSSGEPEMWLSPATE